MSEEAGRPREGEVRVEAWISSAEAESHAESVGGLGGWFGSDGQTHTWQDYLDHWQPAVHPYLQALKDDVLASGRFICGNNHQDDPDGTPLFDDGTVGSFSFRAWGDLMAAIATVKDGQPHNYMEFYYA